jgi:putative phage-type endonuclease
MTEVFDNPKFITNLNRRIKQICREQNKSYTCYRKEVYALIEIPEVQAVWVRRRKIHRLLKLYGKADQRTDAWLLKRGEMITASEVCKAFASATPSARKEMLLRKVNPKESIGQGPSMTACLWGTQFEPIAKEIYANLQGGAEVVDTTCVVHPKYPFLGASPDGIVLMKNPLDPDWGKLVEFKCPISRKFTQDTAIPDAYYHQMQMQMECTGLDTCDYCEMQFVRCNQTDWRASTSPYKGVLAVYDSGEIVYKADGVDVKEWKKTLLDDEYRLVFWTLENIRIEAVPKDPNWLNKYLPDLEAFWAIVQECRADPSKMEQYIPRTDPPDVPSKTLAVEMESPETKDGSSSAHTMILHLDDASIP